jgi:hypothetical protein
VRREQGHSSALSVPRTSIAYCRVAFVPELTLVTLGRRAPGYDLLVTELFGETILPSVRIVQANTCRVKFSSLKMPRTPK